MKTICHNWEIEVRAENEQDSLWLFGWLYWLRKDKGMDDYIEIELGDFGYDGTYKMLDKTWMSEFRKNSKHSQGNYIYCETNHEEHYGTEAQVGAVTINPLGF
jgi:hypothetical protein